jgi:thymidylate synthase
MKPFEERTVDTQYRDRIEFILKNGVLIKDTPQGIGAITCFGTVPPIVYDLSNGFPAITERKIGFWKKPLSEIIAFINGARTIDKLAEFGCDFWEDYRGAGTKFGLAPDDLGPGSYGAAFHDFEIPEGGTLNQFERLIGLIRDYPSVRTLLITPWKPYYTARGPHQKVVVAPCHGWLHFRVIEGKLHMRMDQRSADMPIGVPSNMVQYAALLMMICQVTGYEPGNYVHSFADAHIYEDQVDTMKELLTRESRPFPTLILDKNISNLFDFRSEHFELKDYNPNPSMKVAYRP